MKLVEYIKYFEYKSKTAPWRDRRFEVRAMVTIEDEEDPEDKWDWVERLIDEGMMELGIDTEFFISKKVGFEILGYVKRRRAVHIKVFDELRGYVWSVTLAIEKG